MPFTLNDQQKRWAIQQHGFDPDAYDLSDDGFIRPRATPEQPALSNDIYQPKIQAAPRRDTFGALGTATGTFMENAPEAAGGGAAFIPGAKLGSKIPGPPWLKGVGGLAGGTIAALGGSALVSAADDIMNELNQDYPALKYVNSSALDTIKQLLFDSQSFGEKLAASQQKHPIAALSGSVATMPLAGMNPAPLRALRAAQHGIPWMLGHRPMANEIANIKNVAIGAALQPAIATGRSLAETGEMPSTGDLFTELLLGSVFSKPNVIGRGYGFTDPLTETPQLFPGEAQAAHPEGIASRIKAAPAPPAIGVDRSMTPLGVLNRLSTGTGPMVINTGQKGAKPIPVIGAKMTGKKGSEVRYPYINKSDILTAQEAEGARTIPRVALEPDVTQRNIEFGLMKQEARAQELSKSIAEMQQEQARVAAEAKDALNVALANENRQLKMALGVQAQPEAITGRGIAAAPERRTPPLYTENVGPGKSVEIRQPEKVPLETIEPGRTDAEITQDILEDTGAKYSEGSPIEKAPLTEFEQTTLRQLKEQDKPTNPTAAWFQMFSNVGAQLRNTKLKFDKIVNSRGEPQAGQTLMREGLEPALVKLSNAIENPAGLDTAPHEMITHVFLRDLLKSKRPQDVTIAKDYLTKIGADAELAKINEARKAQGRSPWSAEEFIAHEQGMEYLRRQFNLEGETPFKTWQRDLVSYLRTRFSPENATPADYRRLLTYKFMTDPAFHEVFKGAAKPSAAGALVGTAGKELFSEEATVPVNHPDAKALIDNTIEGLRNQTLPTDEARNTKTRLLANVNFKDYPKLKDALDAVDSGSMTSWIRFRALLNRVVAGKDIPDVATLKSMTETQNVGQKIEEALGKTETTVEAAPAAESKLALSPEVRAALDAKFAGKNVPAPIKNSREYRLWKQAVDAEKPALLPLEEAQARAATIRKNLLKQGNALSADVEKHQFKPEPYKPLPPEKKAEFNAKWKAYIEKLKKEGRYESEIGGQFSERSPIERGGMESLDYSEADLTRYKELKLEQSELKESGKIVDSKTGELSNEWNTNWQQFEELRNKYNGMPPRQLTAPEPSTFQYGNLDAAQQSEYAQLHSAAMEARQNHDKLPTDETADKLIDAELALQQFEIDNMSGGQFSERSPIEAKEIDKSSKQSLEDQLAYSLIARSKSEEHRYFDYHRLPDVTKINDITLLKKLVKAIDSTVLVDRDGTTQVSDSYGMRKAFKSDIDFRLAELKATELPHETKTKLLKTFSNVADEVSNRTTYGVRQETAAASGYLTSWNNSSARWEVSSRRFVKGENVQLDANEIIVPALSQTHAALIAKNLPALPLYQGSFEQKGQLKSLGAKLNPNSTEYRILAETFGEEQLKLAKPDTIEAVEKFMDFLHYKSSKEGEAGLDIPPEQEVQFSERSPIDMAAYAKRDRQSFAPFLTGRIDKIAEELKMPTANYVVEKLHKFEGDSSRMEGQIGNKLVASLKGYSPTSIDRVHRYLHQMDDKGKSVINLSAKEQSLAKRFVEVLRDFRRTQIAEGLKVKSGGGYRVAGIKPEGYIFNMLDPQVAYTWAEKPASAEGKNYDALYLKHQQEHGVSEEDARTMLRKYKNALGNQVSNDVEFNALRLAEGNGLPWELVDKNLASAAIRYGRRAARDMAFFKHIQNDPVMRKALSVRDQEGKLTADTDLPEIQNISTTRSVQQAMRSVYGIDMPANPELMAVARLAANHVMGIGSAARNLLTMPAFISNYVQVKQLPLVFDALSKLNETRVRAFENNAVKASFADFDAAGYYEGSPNPAIRFLNRWSDFMRKYQGRDLSDRIEGELYYGIGELLAVDNIAKAKQGNKESALWVKKFGDTVDGGPERLLTGKVTNDDIQRMAKRMVDAARGTYSQEGLPGWAIEGNIAPFAALARFSLEKSNTVWKDVVLPAKQGIYGPLIRYSLASLGVGMVIDKLNDLLSNKRGQDPKINEILAAGKEEELVPKAIALLQLASFAGTISDGAKLAVNAYKGKSLKYNQPLSFPLYTLATETILGNLSDAAKAIKDGEDPFEVMGNLAVALSTQSVQTLRYAQANTMGAEEVARKEKFRDYQVWKELSGEEPRQQMDRADVIGGQTEKRFKKTDDLGEAVELLPKLLERALKKAGSDPEKLKNELTSLKINNYQTMPNFDTMPASFTKYLAWLTKTQGADVAAERLRDYIRQNEINREKSRLVPTF